MKQHHKWKITVIVIVLVSTIIVGSWYQRANSLKASALFGLQKFEQKSIIGGSQVHSVYFNQDLQVVNKATKRGYDRQEYIEKDQQTIYYSAKQLKYEIAGQEVRTDQLNNEGQEGEVYAVYDDDQYVVSVEILSKRPVAEGDVYGKERSRIVNLETKEQVVVEGLFFNPCQLHDGSLYCSTFDHLDGSYSRVIDISTMQETRYQLPDECINRFIYIHNNEVYVQSTGKISTPRTHKITKGLFEEVDFYIPELDRLESPQDIFLDRSQSNTDGNKHYIYFGRDKDDESIYRAYIITTSVLAGIDVREIQLAYDAIIAVQDGIYVEGKYYLYYNARTNPDVVKTRIVEFDATGKVVQRVDISDVIVTGWSVPTFC